MKKKRCCIGGGGGGAQQDSLVLSNELATVKLNWPPSKVSEDAFLSLSPLKYATNPRNRRIACS